MVAIAERASYGRGRKSLALTWGTIGRRTVPARVSVADPEIALATIRTLLPSAVRVKESVDVRAATPAVLASLSDTGALPDGFEYEAEHEKAFAKVTL